MTMTVTEAKMVLAGKTTQLRLRLSNEAIAVLREMAAREFRDPKQQAEYILEQVLLGEDLLKDVCVGPSEAAATQG